LTGIPKRIETAPQSAQTPPSTYKRTDITPHQVHLSRSQQPAYPLTGKHFCLARHINISITKQALKLELTPHIVANALIQLKIPHGSCPLGPSGLMKRNSFQPPRFNRWDIQKDCFKSGGRDDVQAARIALCL
jgi:hypothetical protein